MNFLKKPLLFLLGGSAYVGVEYLWRGWSHGSMFFAGGICFLLLGKIAAIRQKPPLVLRALLGASAITVVELLMGLLVNRSYRVWDYRQMPLNFRGQICLPYFFLWMPLSLAGMALYRLTDRLLFKKH